MKKCLSIGLVALLLILSILPAYAVSPSSQSMEISTSTEPAYELTYPADTQIPWNTESMVVGQVKAEKMLIEPNKCVKVSVTSANDFKLLNEFDAKKTIAYTLSGDDIIFLPGDYGKSAPLTVAIKDSQWQQAASGRHSDILTFTAEYTDAD